MTFILFNNFKLFQKSELGACFMLSGLLELKAYLKIIDCWTGHDKLSEMFLITET
jgi:hypothetical protein